MEAPHPDERPAKKRRFFTEDSSPVQIRTKQPSEHAPPPSPPPTVGSHEEAQPAAEAPAENPSVDSEGFDVGMLEAVVGELSISTIKQLKDVSGNNVERGRR
jgi:DNA repair protein RAD5